MDRESVGVDSPGAPRLALVLWKGDIGGAEVLSVALAEQMRELGCEATVVFIEGSEPLGARLRALDLPYLTLGLSRGREIVRRPRRYASAVRAAGPDGALLVTCGYMGASLRLGGYRAPIVAVEHGDLLYEAGRKALRLGIRRAGAWADDVEVGVSDFVFGRLGAVPHAKDLRRIYNGIDPAAFLGPSTAPSSDAAAGSCALGFAGRLVFGKGADHLLRALALTAEPGRFRLALAGDGPERPRLEELSGRLGLGGAVTFVGLAHAMPEFWRSCDLAVVPSAEFVEACPMTPLEAMAAAKPVLGTRNGGLGELILDGATGALVPPGDPHALAAALDRYAGDADLRLAHGEAGRDRVEELFHIERCAHDYLGIFAELAAGR